MPKDATRFPVPFDADSFNQLWDKVEYLGNLHWDLVRLLGVDKAAQDDHPVLGSPVHLRSNDGQGHTRCMPAFCISTDPEEPDIITVVAFTRGDEGIGPQPAARRTDVRKSVSEHLSWHWPDDAEAHAWRPPRKTEE